MRKVLVVLSMVTWWMSATVERVPVHPSPQRGTATQEDTAGDGGIKLFLSVIVMFGGHGLTGGISKSL